MRVFLRGYDIDNIAYDSSGNYQIKPTQNTNNIYYGQLNTNRTQYIFKNINLKAIIGYEKFDKINTFNIKFVGVRAINENGLNVIDYTSPPQLRTSNIYISGLTFYNNNTSNILCQFTNFNPNEEIVFDNVWFHVGNVGNYLHFFEFSRANPYGKTLDWFRLAGQESATDPANSLLRYLVNSPYITDLDGKIMRASQAQFYYPTNNALFFIYVQDAGDGTLPSHINQTTNTITITVLPENNSWFHHRFTDDIIQDENQTILTAYNPTNPIIDLTFELRDLLTNQLQPVIAEPNNKVYPSLEFILDIE